MTVHDERQSEASLHYDPSEESGIVFLDSLLKYPYLREATAIFARRKNPPKLNYNVVAYSVLGPGGKSITRGRFKRRFWYTGGHDPHGSPMQGVDPGSIAAGKFSLRNGWQTHDDVYKPL